MAGRKPSSALRARYRKVKLPDGSTRDEHRHVMELHLGRRLARNEVVHHRNGNPKDNRLENLEVMTLAEHGRLHHAGKPAKVRGTRVATAVLTEELVIEARRLVAAGEPVRALARRLGLHQTTLGKAVRGQTWRHVAAAVPARAA